MQLPVYDKVQYFNFYDCLAAFSTQVFSEQHKIDYENRKIRIEDAKKARAYHQLRKIDRIQQGDAEYEALDIID